MESLALLVALLMLVVLLLPWNILVFLKLSRKYSIPRWLKIAVLGLSVVEFLFWLAIYINFIINVNFIVGSVISISWYAFYLSHKEFKLVLKQVKR